MQSFPSPGTPGEGRVRVLLNNRVSQRSPHLNPLPAYRERKQRGKQIRDNARFLFFAGAIIVRIDEIDRKSLEVTQVLENSMADDLQTLLDAADNLGKLVAKHPAVAKYRDAQRAVSQDAEASRLMADFSRQIEGLARQEQTGMPITDAQRTQLEGLQSRIASHIKVKALNLAEVDFTDVLRKVSQSWQKHLAETTSAPAGAKPQ
jgi:cell fate (sporulation/competence/biofilm development) regulator YlbF (YheA/YmcA/DUF963 family)